MRIVKRIYNPNDHLYEIYPHELEINETIEGNRCASSDGPKSVRNRCVIDVFGGVFMLSR